MTLHDEIAKATIENVRSSLMRHMPLSPQRDYYLWGISKANPYREDFLQMVGINQLIEKEFYFFPGNHAWLYLQSSFGYPYFSSTQVTTAEFLFAIAKL